VSRGDRSRPARLRGPPRPHVWAALALALLVLAYLWPVLVGGRILSPLALLYYYAPWSNHQPPGFQQYVNQVLTDVPQADYPWLHLARELIRQGTFPAWNPHVLAGTPFFSNPQVGLFTPFDLPLWLLPLNYGIGVGAALKLWAGGFGTYLLVRQLGLGLLPGLLAGVSFALCSLNVVWLTHETLPAVAVLVPWMLLVIERIYARTGLGWTLALALATAVALAGGHPGTQLHALLAAGLYALVRAATLPGLATAARLRRLALAGAGLSLGSLLLAVILVPELYASHGTVGTLVRKGGLGGLPGTQMPLAAIRTVLFPDWWGRPSGVEAEHVAVNYNEGTFYAGVVATLLAVVGLVAPGGWRRKAPFVVLGVVGLAVPLRAPVLYGLVEHLPGLELVQNQRMHFLFELAAAVLAAFGLQAVLDRPAGERRRIAVVGAAALAAVAGYAAVGPDADLAGLSGRVLAGTPSRSNGALALTSVAWFALLAGAASVALAAAWLRPARAVAVAAALVLLAAFDMLHFAHGYQPMGPAGIVVPPRTATVAYLQRHAREGRFVAVGTALPNDWEIVYGLDDVRGYDPPQPTLRYYRLWRMLNADQTTWQRLGLSELSATSVRVLGVLGVRYVVTEPAASASEGAEPEGGAATLHVLRRVRADADATIYRNALALPRALVAPRVRVTAGEPETVATLSEARFDPRRTVVVERDQPGAGALARAAPVHGRVAVAAERNAQVTLRATLDHTGLVVLDDQLAPGWTVRIDGRAARVLRVDDVMRGVVVGPGGHLIVWSYRVPGLALGVLLSVLALMLLLGGGALVGVRALRSR
jgi:hypothetical protein